MMRVVAYEDRPGDLIGVKLLLLSLSRVCPGLCVDLVFPDAPDRLSDWLSGLSMVTLHRSGSLKRSGYDVKPSMLKWALDNGASQAIWIDTDVIVTRDFRTLFADLDDSVVAVTEEWFGAPFQGGDYRSRAWGLPTGRRLKNTTNTAVVRMTGRHFRLLQEWDRLLGRQEYAAAQSMPWHKRPIHLQGDQEVLCALLESGDFSDTPIRFIRRGKDIAHCFQHQGYPIHQILGNLFTGNRPYFVHGQGAKPWRDDNTFRAFLDVSPYTLCAAKYAEELDENISWLAPQSAESRKWRRAFRDNPWLCSLPLECAAEMKNQRIAKTFVKGLLGRP